MSKNMAEKLITPAAHKPTGGDELGRRTRRSVSYRLIRDRNLAGVENPVVVRTLESQDFTECLPMKSIHACGMSVADNSRFRGVQNYGL